MISFIKKLTVHAQFLVFNRQVPTRKRKEMLKMFMLKKKKINDKFHKETYRTYPISSVQSNPEDLQKKFERNVN